MKKNVGTVDMVHSFNYCGNYSRALLYQDYFRNVRRGVVSSWWSDALYRNHPFLPALSGAGNEHLSEKMSNPGKLIR